MRKSAFLTSLITVALWAGAVRPAAAQFFGPPPEAMQPTFSPWMNLFQRNTGPLDNYHTYVRPEMQLRDTLQQQSMRLQRQQMQFDMLGVQVGDLEKQGTVRPTGTPSVFMNFSHFYVAPPDMGLPVHRPPVQ